VLFRVFGLQRHKKYANPIISMGSVVTSIDATSSQQFPDKKKCSFFSPTVTKVLLAITAALGFAGATTLGILGLGLGLIGGPLLLPVIVSLGILTVISLAAFIAFLIIQRPEKNAARIGCA
jgi:hypothetical protein